MGETTVFKCASCGYSSGDVRWGVGSRDARVRFLPALCLSCRGVVEIDLTGRDVLIEKFSCPGCGHAVTFFHKAESYDCPRCGTANLRMTQKKYW